MLICSHPSVPPSSFLIVAWVRRWASRCVQHYCGAHTNTVANKAITDTHKHTQANTLPLMRNQWLKKKKKGKCEYTIDNCSENHLPCVEAQKAPWYWHTDLQNVISWHCFANLHLCLVDTHSYTLLWQPSSIVHQILWDVCKKQLYFCSMNKLTSLQICSSQLQ